LLFKSDHSIITSSEPTHVILAPESKNPIGLTIKEVDNTVADAIAEVKIYKAGNTISLLVKKFITVLGTDDLVQVALEKTLGGVVIAITVFGLCYMFVKKPITALTIFNHITSIPTLPTVDFSLSKYPLAECVKDHATHKSVEVAIDVFWKCLKKVLIMVK
jgi:hypothetical protein